MKPSHADLNVIGMALGFAAGALVVILPIWIGGGMFYDRGMVHGGGIMGQGTMWSYGGMSPIGAAFLFVIFAALIGALVAVVHNSVARK
jgi:hypothetical protein